MKKINWKRYTVVVICHILMATLLWSGWELTYRSWAWWVIIVPYLFAVNIAYDWVFGTW